MSQQASKYPALNLGHDFWMHYRTAPSIIQAEVDTMLEGANKRVSEDTVYWAEYYTNEIMTKYIMREIQSYTDTQAIRYEITTEEDGMPSIVTVNGSCMEALGVNDGDHLLIDSSKRPKQAGDVCLIIATHPAQRSLRLQSMIKGFYGVYCGSQWVKEYYTERTNHTLRVRPWGFCGIAFACYTADWHLKWTRDISDYPEELSRETTLDEEPSNISRFVRIKAVEWEEATA